MAHRPPLERLARAAERDPHAGNAGGQPLGNGQTGKQVSPGAAAGEDDVHGIFLHRSGPLSVGERVRASKRLDTSSSSEGDINC